MSVIDNDYIVLYYYSRRGVYTTEQTTGWRLRTLSVLLVLGSLFAAAGMEMVSDRLNGDRSCRAFRKLIRTPPEVGSFDAPLPCSSKIF